MKKWQKITGIVALAVLAVVNVVTCVSASLQVYTKRGGLQSPYSFIEDLKTIFLDALGDVSRIAKVNYLIAIFFFVCLWRKGGKR